MKKIFALIVLFFAFSMSSHAQQKNANGFDREQMIKDTNEMATFLTIDNDLKQAFLQLVDMRIESVATTSTPADAKKINDAYNHKILAGLSKEKREQLMANKALYKKIIIE